MSAYLCDQEHISALAGYAVFYQLHHTVDASDRIEAIAKLLYDENQRSLTYRYGEPVDIPFELDTAYSNPGYASRLTPVAVLKAVQCYMYQACEHPEWRQSAAFALCEEITWSAIRRLPDYDKASWGTPVPA